MAITALPSVPQRGDPSNFAARADALLTALPTFVAETNAVQTDVNAKQVAAANSASSAAASQSSAAASAASTSATANAAAWVNGGTYAINSNAISQINFQTYRKKTASSVTTIDPVNDLTNWVLIGTNGLSVIDVTTTTQAALAGNHYVLTNVSLTTLTLPLSPLSGDTVAVTIANSLITNVIARNGQTIMMLAQDLTVDNATATLTLRFINSSWRLV